MAKVYELRLMDGTTHSLWHKPTKDEVDALKVTAYRQVHGIPSDQPLTKAQLKEALSWEKK